MLYDDFSSSLIQRSIVHCSGLAKAHTGYADLRNLNICFSKFCIFHLNLLFVSLLWILTIKKNVYSYFVQQK